MQRLRILTYLSPSIPLGLYELIARDLGEQCGLDAEVACETRISGPLDGDADLFANAAADVGFICAPSFRWLNASRREVELLPLPVPTDARAEGKPVYFADVIVREESDAHVLADLRGARWSFNDRNSKSGWFSMRDRIAPQVPAEFFSELIAAGSHLRSLELVASGAADAAAIDSNTLRLNPRPGLRVIESWGPFPIQPAIVRAALPPEQKSRIAAALRTMHERHATALQAFGVSRFVNGDEAAYR